MENFLEELNNEGCDTKSALERCINDEEFYLDCLKEAISDSAFDKLGEELKAGNVKAAFEYSHSLKGVIGNMSLTPLYDKIVEIVEPLRKGNGNGLEKTYEEMLEIKDKLKRIIDKY